VCPSLSSASFESCRRRIRTNHVCLAISGLSQLWRPRTLSDIHHQQQHNYSSILLCCVAQHASVVVYGDAQIRQASLVSKAAVLHQISKASCSVNRNAYAGPVSRENPSLRPPAGWQGLRNIPTTPNINEAQLEFFLRVMHSQSRCRPLTKR